MTLYIFAAIVYLSKNCNVLHTFFHTGMPQMPMPPPAPPGMVPPPPAPPGSNQPRAPPPPGMPPPPPMGMPPRAPYGPPMGKHCALWCHIGVYNLSVPPPVTCMKNIVVVIE